MYKTGPDTRHKMGLVCVLFAYENNTDGPTDGHDLLQRCDGTSKKKKKRKKKMKEMQKEKKKKMQKKKKKKNKKKEKENEK